MLIINNVANTSSSISKSFSARGIKFDFYQPKTNANTSSRLALLFARLLLPSILFFKSWSFKTVYFHYATLAYYYLAGSSDLVVHCHGTDLRENLNNRHYGKTYRALRKAKLLFYSTPDLRSCIPSEFLDKSFFIPNPVDTSFFSISVCRATVKQAKVFFISKMDRTKGVDVLLPLLRLLLEDERVGQVSVFSHGNVEGVDLPSHPKVRCLGRLSRKEMLNEFLGHDIAVGQMQLGAIGVTELEAMACGLPVITHFTYQDAYSEPPPLFLASSVESALAQADRLLTSPELREKAGREGAAWVESYHESDRVCELILKYFEQFDIKLEYQ